MRRLASFLYHAAEVNKSVTCRAMNQCVACVVLGSFVRAELNTRGPVTPFPLIGDTGFRERGTEGIRALHEKERAGGFSPTPGPGIVYPAVIAAIVAGRQLALSRGFRPPSR